MTLYVQLNPADLVINILDLSTDVAAEYLAAGIDIALLPPLMDPTPGMLCQRDGFGVVTGFTVDTAWVAQHQADTQGALPTEYPDGGVTKPDNWPPLSPPVRFEIREDGTIGDTVLSGSGQLPNQTVPTVGPEIQCDFTGSWNAGDILKVEWWGRWTNGVGGVAQCVVWAEVSLDGGSTWKKLRNSLNGGMTQTATNDGAWDQAGTGAIACAVAPRVRLGYLAFPGTSTCDRGNGEGFTLRCTRYPAYLWGQGPIGTLV